MEILLSSDDTDSLNSPGTGKHLERLSRILHYHSLVKDYSQISRHQLYFHKDIPYTSHNSAMCLKADADGNRVVDLIHFARQYLIQSITKEEARTVAEKVRVHLSGYGINGDELIGAFAAVGLRLHGSDDRIRAWVNFGKKGDVVACEEFCGSPNGDAVVNVTENFQLLSAQNQIEVSEEKIKTILVNN